jgi:hypothetical protein
MKGMTYLVDLFFSQATNRGDDIDNDLYDARITTSEQKISRKRTKYQPSAPSVV